MLTSPSKSLRLRIVLAVVSGMLIRLGCPTYSWWWAAPFALLPLLAALDGLGPKRSFGVAFATGFVWTFWGFFWITELLVKFAGMSVLAATPLALVFGLYHGASFGLFGAGLAYVRKATRWPMWVCAPPLYVCMEACWPSIFPFYLGVTVSAQPVLAQTAELGSITLVGGLVVAFSGALYELAKARGRKRPWRKHAVAGLVVLLGAPAYGAIRMSQVDADIAAARTLKVGVVQGNMSITEIYDRKQQVGILRKQQRVSAELEKQGAQLLLWGETAVPTSKAFPRTASHEPEGKWRIHRGFSAPALVGAVTRDPEASPYAWNSAVLVGRDGSLQGFYDKVFLLVFGEYVPLVDPEWFMGIVQGAAHLNRGAGPVVIESEGARILPLICYEGILPRYVQQGASAGIHFFANLTNDAWFGKTHESAEHLALATFRSIEHRKGMVRAVNTGISAYIDPNGRVVRQTTLVDPDVDGPRKAVGFVADVPLMDPDHRTPYGRTGELFNVLCALFLIFGVARARRAAAQGPSL